MVYNRTAAPDSSQKQLMPDNFFIIRPSAIGDVVMASPMIHALKSSYPDCRITWLADPSARELLAGNPLLDDIIYWDKAGWVRLWKERQFIALFNAIKRFIRRLRSQQYDLVLDAQGLLRTRLMAAMIRSKKRIGFSSREPGHFLMSRIISRGPNKHRMSSEYLHMIKQIGIHPNGFHPSLVLSCSVIQNARKKLADAGLSRSAPYILFCPFTTRPQKHWSEARWARLADQMADELNLPVVLMGGKPDADAGTRIQSRSDLSIINFIGRTTIGEAAAIVKEAQLVVGVDTGLTHMATVFNRPTIALFGATRPYLETDNPLTRVLYHQFPCSPCKRRPTCQGRFDCMQAHSVESVLQTALDLSRLNPNNPSKEYMTLDLVV